MSILLLPGLIRTQAERKTSVARVRIRPGDGKMLINKRELNNFFRSDQDRKTAVMAPLAAAKAEKTLDVFVNVNGGVTRAGGHNVLGIARALKIYDPSLAQMLRESGFLTRDPRMVERKKAGQSGARKRYQFSKR